ncbi:MAG: NAD-dependent malic enzyme [Legionellaceae bacterium]
MLNYKRYKKDGKEWLETSLTGKPLLTTPQVNKGTAFTEYEREIFNLTGKLPASIESLATQVKRAYLQFASYHTPIQKNNFLHHLHDQNETLFYRLVKEYLPEMLPIIYTPTVGQAVKAFSHDFSQTRGIYLAYPDRHRIHEILRNRSNPEVDLIVVTDGEGVLGIGDQGIGGMAIPIAKLMVYTLCGCIDPARTLAIQLDVGTNNSELLNDPLYLGWRHPRLSQQEYDEFIDLFISAVKEEFPNIFLHWEDFGRDNARRNLERFQNELCTFNDDIQGTGAVTLAALLAAVEATNTSLSHHKIVVFGAGTAGTGITDQICAALVREGLTLEEARQRFWLIDRQGLLLDEMETLTPSQKIYARPTQECIAWPRLHSDFISLLDTVKMVKPTILIGCSARTGAFTRELIQEMAYYVEHPIILPLSNPNEYCEAEPVDIMTWTQGKALIATGSPFNNITVNGNETRIAQCNNALVFPGIGLGILAVKATQLTDNMIWVACQTLSEHAPVRHDLSLPLLPSIEEAQAISYKIAVAVAKQAQKENVAQITNENIEKLINDISWEANYIPYQKISDY